MVEARIGFVHEILPMGKWTVQVPTATSDIDRYFFLGSSSGFTKVTADGPMKLSWRIVSSSPVQVRQGV